MGAEPLAVQDAIICGHLDGAVVNRIVASIADACRAQGCTLTGGETSEQPGVIEPGTYILVANVVGVVERSKIIDGATIAAGDQVLSVAANGLHPTATHSCGRCWHAIPAWRRPRWMRTDSSMSSCARTAPTTWRCVTSSASGSARHGAHYRRRDRGQSAADHPDGLRADIDLAQLHPPAVFHTIRERGNVDDADMLRTFNLGAGLLLVVAPDFLSQGAA